MGAVCLSSSKQEHGSGLYLDHQRSRPLSRQERVLARLRNESMELLAENEKLADEINRLTQSLALEESSPKSAVSGEFVSMSTPTTTTPGGGFTLSPGRHSEHSSISMSHHPSHGLPASLNPLFRSGPSNEVVESPVDQRFGASSTEIIVS